MADDTTAQQLCRDYAMDLTRLQKYGATFNFQMKTGTRIEIEFADGEQVNIVFATPKKKATQHA